MADINFDCPHCGHNLEVSERGAGLTVVCPECSKSIVIPMPAPEVLVSKIIFNCGSCGQPLKAAPDMAGQLIDCPACKKPTEIPFPPRPTPPTPTRHAAIAQATRKESIMKEYKVLTQKDKWFAGKFDPEKLEQAINSYAAQGWQVISVATASIPSAFGGNREEMIVVMGRDK